MGNSIFTRLFDKEEDYRILFVGPYEAGKNSLLKTMNLGEMVVSTSVIDFTCKTVHFKNVEFTCFDVGGRAKVRPLYRHYYRNTRGLVYVLDSTDRERFDHAMAELLERLASEDELRDVPILILANKQDLPGAMSPSVIEDHIFQKRCLRNRPWLVCGSSTVSPDGQSQLYEGMEWLSDQVKRGKKQRWYEEYVKKSNKSVETVVKKVKKTDANSNGSVNAGVQSDSTDKGGSKMRYLTDIALSVKELLKS